MIHILIEPDQLMQSQLRLGVYSMPPPEVVSALSKGGCIGENGFLGRSWPLAGMVP
jgi:hypothetical protein